MIPIESFVESPLRDLLAEAISLELQALNQDDQASVLTWVQSLSDSGLYQFFTKPSIESIVGYVGDTLALRQYVLSLHERTAVMLSLSDEMGMQHLQATYQEIIETIVATRAEYMENQTLLPNAVSNALYINTAELKTALMANTWLVTLYLSLSLGAFRLASNFFFKDL